MVMSVGGRKLCDACDLLCLEIQNRHLFVVIFHSGTNNINKLNIPEQVQLAHARHSLNNVARNIIVLQQTTNCAMVFSGGVYTRSTIINSRVDVLNDWIRRACTTYGCMYIDNRDIDKHMLRDAVHLNAIGCKTLEHNFKGLL